MYVRTVPLPFVSPVPLRMHVQLLSYYACIVFLLLIAHCSSPVVYALLLYYSVGAVPLPKGLFCPSPFVYELFLCYCVFTVALLLCMLCSNTVVTWCDQNQMCRAK
jgi:hypothetical protein